MLSISSALPPQSVHDSLLCGRQGDEVERRTKHGHATGIVRGKRGGSNSNSEEDRERQCGIVQTAGYGTVKRESMRR